jgi:DNA helicase-2/ATP-dependent DNA helicase PcrA
LNLPYKIYGGLSFYQRKEIKDLIAYFRLSANPKDEEALKRVINYPKRGIGKTSMDSVILAARQYDVSLWDVISDFQRYPVSISSGALNKIAQFALKIQSYTAQLETSPAYDLANNVAQSSGILKDLYDDKSPEGVTRYENIQELLAGIKEFSVQQEEKDEIGTLSDFLIDVALLTDADKEKEEDKNTITLMTIHASKGLEFPHVFIVGLEENLFPSQLSLTSRTDLEEERRLFYVAITRAEKTCTLSYVVSRYRWGQLVTAEPSRFIDEVDKAFVSHENETRGRSGGKSLSGYQRPSEDRSQAFGKLGGEKRNLKTMREASSAPTKSGSGTTDALKVGYNVEHARFGKGKVTAIAGDGMDKKATVFFPRVGQKTLILKFAKLSVINGE